MLIHEGQWISDGNHSCRVVLRLVALLHFSLISGYGELPVKRCGIVDQNLLTQGRIRSPPRQQVKEMTVVNAKQRRNIIRLAASAGIGMWPVRTPQNPVGIGFD